jgi:hypothetical protein
VFRPHRDGACTKPSVPSQESSAFAGAEAVQRVTERNGNGFDRHLCSVEDINVRQIAIVIRNGFQLNDFECVEIC